MPITPFAAAPVCSLRILYVEDHPELRLVLGAVFERDGHSVTAVADGATAFNTFAEAPDAFDLVVTDHQMPGLTGLELIASLRAADYAGHVVLHSSLEDESILDAYAALHLDAFLAKPSSLAEIRSVLRSISLAVNAASAQVTLRSATIAVS